MSRLFKWLWRQLKDWRNLIIFGVVVVIVSCEVWVPYLIYFITGDTYWVGIGSVCWAFWLAPFTPFLPLCVAITLGVRKIIEIIKKPRHKERDE